MKVELHMIQNFAPSCLNRDDTNSPKDCTFGGVRRARISSQCIKRAIRKAFREDQLLPAEHLAWRTKRLAEEVGRRLARSGKDQETAQVAAEAAIGGLGLGVGDDGQTQYLVFLGESGIEAMVRLCDSNWNELEKVAAKVKQAQAEADEGKARRTAREAKKAAKDAVPDEIKKGMEAVLDGRKTADLALFGRMLADLPRRNIDAACQVAHAISTHKIAMEMDFYTAVDDLKGPEEDPGAGMMGVIGYNSACFYRYCVLDWKQLVENLVGDADLARRTVEALLRALATALPTGKQNTFAAHSRPDFILAVVRDKGAPLSLANAFVKPARPTGGKDLTTASVDQVAKYWKGVTGVFGTEGVLAQPCCGTTLPTDGDVGWQRLGSFDELVTAVLEALPAEGQS